MGGLAIVPGPDAAASAKRPRFRIFISYASEDVAVAEAIGKCLKTALGRYFAEINLDKWFLQSGVPFKGQIESRLEESDVLIIVYSGVGKLSHGYTGWEVGFFDHLMRTVPERRKIAMYLDTPPAISADEQGVSLKIGTNLLQSTVDEFESQITVSLDDPLCQLILDWQKKVAEIGEYDVREIEPQQDPATCVKNLRLEIFRYLKTTVDITLKPQKQITLKAKGPALQQMGHALPPDAELVPVGMGGSMSIFGLADVPITWERFLHDTSDNKFCNSWRDAITSVVLSSFPNKIDVDNSQIIVSVDEAKAYRIILTTATRYYDDNREFNLYFVETLRRTEYGDEATTLLLKGLELVCRFRFLFLEAGSDFSYRNVQMMPPDRMAELVGRMQKELDLLRKDSRDAGLDQPKTWSRYVRWEDIEKMGAEYGPREEKIRSLASEILEAKGHADRVVQLRQEMSNVLKDLAEKIKPENTNLLKQMSEKLQELAIGKDF